MSERPTPETDGQCYDCEYRGDMGGRFTADPGKLDPYGDHVSADFARQLERERDEARETARDLQDCLEVALGKIANLRRHFGQVYVWDSLVNEDIIEQCGVSLAKSKEALL